MGSYQYIYKYTKHLISILEITFEQFSELDECIIK